MAEKKPTAKVKSGVIKTPETKKAPAAPAKAAPEKKEELKAEVTLQFNGNDYTAERLIQSAKDVWQYDMGRDVADFKSVKIFVKPDDRKAYAVVNETEQLSFDI